MDKAKALLSHPGLKIYEISEAVGYRSTQHFITEFKKSTGVTPKQYRDS
jgi:AraC-like DNA-binding protein